MVGTQHTGILRSLHDARDEVIPCGKSMRNRRFGRLGWQVSEIGYGMWGMGGWTGSEDAESLASLDRAVELGCTFFDTAHAYGDGHSEKLLGATLRKHRDRKLYVATKVPPKNRRWPGRAETPIEEVFPHDYIIEMTRQSRTNLGVDRIDLQQLHVWSDAWVADTGWQRAVAELKNEGVIEGFGISVNRWEPANVLQALGTGLVDVVQVVYNIFDQAPEDTLFPACEQLDVAVIARVPFDEGSLTGTLTADSRWPEGDWRNLYFSPPHLQATLPRVEGVQKQVPPGSTLPDLALRFILHHEAVSTTIPGMRKRRNVEANVAASGAAPLSPELVRELRRHRWDRGWQVP
jgi:aryl-alcohol dehydrogenase-like predicted oxidoreductase